MDDFIYEEVNIGSRRRNVSLGLYMKEKLHSSPRIEVYESDAFGRCLYLDGSLQTTERDEHLYHETIAHIPLLRTTPKRVLIIGGGDGGTLREVLKHKSRGLEKVVMVEINPEVIEVSKKYMPTFRLEESLKDPIVQLVIQDGARYLENVQMERFDVIIIDCPDPSPESNVLYSREFLECSVVPTLAPNGVVMIQAGNVFIKEDFVSNLRYEFRRLFPNVQYHYVPMPSYPSGGIGFLMGTSNLLTYITSDMDSIGDRKYQTQLRVRAGASMVPRSYGTNKRKHAFNCHCKNDFNWKEKLKIEELRCIETFLDLDGERKPVDFQYDLMSVDYSMKGGSLFNTSLSFITLENKDKVQAAIKDMAKARGDKLPEDIEFCGVLFNMLSSDEFGHIVKYFTVMKATDVRKKYPDICANMPDPCFEDVLVWSMYLGGTFSARGVISSTLTHDYVMSRDFHFDLPISYEVDRVRTNLESVKGRLHREPQEVVDRFAKEGMILTRVCFHEKWPFQPTLHFSLG